jgi:hypothetical protein
MKALTANRLTDGAVVYLTEAGEWSRLIQDVRALDDVQSEAALSAALAQPHLLVAPYLVEFDEGRPSGRDRLKETIRANGPTVGHSLDAAWCTDTTSSTAPWSGKGSRSSANRWRAGSTAG